MTPEELATASGATLERAKLWLPYIESAMDEFYIDFPVRKAAFLSQIGHESGGLRYTVEIWGPTPAQSRYEGRKDLGNTQPGDGFKYRGRGLIQTTGRNNYFRTGQALGIDLINQPELLSTAELAARSAGWYWRIHDLNKLADDGQIEKITRRINGGVNGLDDRLARYEAAMTVLA